MQFNVKIFEKEEFGKVRVVMQNGEPWFVASDVARALGYADPSDAVRRHCEKVNKITQQGETPVSQNCPPVSLLIIPEEDVYALIFGSNLPSARTFRRWVCDEVLPSIRKTGQYKHRPLTVEDFANPAAAAEYCANLLRQHAASLVMNASLAENYAIEYRGRVAAEARADSLALALGYHTDWKQVSGIEWLSDYIDVREERATQQVGRKLSELSRRMGVEIRRAADRKHGSHGVYHVSVIEEFRRILDTDFNYLGKWRKH